MIMSSSIALAYVPSHSDISADFIISTNNLISASNCVRVCTNIVWGRIVPSKRLGNGRCHSKCPACSGGKGGKRIKVGNSRSGCIVAIKAVRGGDGLITGVKRGMVGFVLGIYQGLVTTPPVVGLILPQKLIPFNNK